ncbi:hypothetical protein CTAYLR_000079 [Chrysophaeum taylorii]|uniref:Deacetylase sirtuin-type domain-containing protein n=1 Tax=Chrysophaeum taylorii TaxID=2483200 RepID=A0AAD7UII7_9STRA|nr:hypothetical protein CTAYLR_000079 [Chrysophaeum taylorii]
MPKKRVREEEEEEEDVRVAVEASRREAKLLVRNEKLLGEIAELIAGKERKGVLFVTGAGLSCASGIAAFRTGEEAVWSRHVTDMGTRKALRKDPLKWYNEFWVPTFEAAKVRDARPSAAHTALAKIAALAPETRVVTQNVDGLHCARKHGSEGVEDPQLVEAHGRAGLYRCLRSGEAPCDEEAARNDWYEPSELSAEDAANLEKAASEGTQLPAPPRCPKCGSVAAPLALLFDECYDAHFFFEADAWDGWMDSAAAFVFVGTSFAVELTREALRRSRERGIPVYDINLVMPPPTITRADVLRHNAILGKAEDILPKLASLVERKLS